MKDKPPRTIGFTWLTGLDYKIFYTSALPQPTPLRFPRPLVKMTGERVVWWCLGGWAAGEDINTTTTIPCPSCFFRPLLPHPHCLVKLLTWQFSRRRSKMSHQQHTSRSPFPYPPLSPYLDIPLVPSPLLECLTLMTIQSATPSFLISPKRYHRSSSVAPTK